MPIAGRGDGWRVAERRAENRWWLVGVYTWGAGFEGFERFDGFKVAVTVAERVESPKGLLARIVGVILSPGATYAEVAARPPVLGALAVLLTSPYK